MSKPRRFIFATDLHGDRQNEAVVNVLHAVTKDFKPDVRIFGGDLFDLRPLRRGASAEEQCETMQDDWNAGVEFLHAWKPTHLLMGNHDDRLFELSENSSAGIKADYARKLVGDLENNLRKLRCEWRPYHKRKGVFSFGRLNFLHGFHHGVYAARQHSAVYGSCVFGHVHAFDVHTFGAFNERKAAYACGGLLEVDQDYNKRHTTSLRHENGFYLGLLHEDGSFTIQEARQTNGHWHIPTGFKCF
jgi:hypothetical protein